VNLKPTAKEVPKKEIISKQVVSTKRETIGTTKKEFPQKDKKIIKESSKEATEPKKVKEESQKIGTSKHIIKESVIATKKEDLEKETPKLDHSKFKKPKEKEEGPVVLGVPDVLLKLLLNILTGCGSYQNSVWSTFSNFFLPEVSTTTRSSKTDIIL